MATNVERTVYVIEMRDKFTRGVTQAEKTTKRFNNAVDKAKTKTKGLADQFRMLKTAAAALAVAGIGRVIKSVADLVGKFQEVRVAFNVMLGNKGLGGSMMAWAKEFSRSTVITFDQTVTSLRKLMAYGIGGGNAKPLTEMLSTIAAGVGTDRLPYLTLALGQVFSRGRLMGTELRQFREHGVDIVAEIAKGLGVGTAEIERRVTAGQISFDMVAEAMMAMTQEGGRFYNMLEEVSKKWNGATAIMSSTWTMFLVEAFNPLIEAATRGVTDITDTLQELRGIDFGPISDTIVTSVGSIKKAFTDLSGILGDDKVLNGARAIAFVATALSQLAMQSGTKISSLSNMAGGIWGGVKGVYKLATAKTDKDAEDAMWDISGAREKFLSGKGAGKSAMESFEEMWNRVWNLGRKTDLTPVETGTYEPTGTSTDPTDPNGSKTSKARTGRAVGTGARDIIINIGNLVENMNNYGMNEDEQQKFKAQMVQALSTVVNDVSLITQR